MYPPHHTPRRSDHGHHGRPVSPPSPARYRLKPVEVDARVMPGDPEVDIESVRAWCGGKVEVHDGQVCVVVDTDGPVRVAHPGDYILKRPRSGEVYVVKARDFADHYEKVNGYR